MGDNFEITPELEKRYHDEHVTKERLIFLALCGENDRKLINGEKELTLEEFDRIVYLLETLGLNNFHWDFCSEHQELLNELGSRIEFEVNNSVDIDPNEILVKVKKWAKDFCNNLPSNESKQYIEEIFRL